MKKRHFNIYLSIVLIIIIPMSIGLTAIKHAIETSEGLIVLEDFTINGETTVLKKKDLNLVK